MKCIGEEVDLEYVLIRSKRKTISIIVEQDGSVIVKAPAILSMNEVEAIVLKKLGWIREKQKKMHLMEKRTQAKEYVNGEHFLYLGKEYTLLLVEDRVNDVPEVKILHNQIQVSGKKLSREIVREALCSWYFEQAKWVIDNQIKMYSAKLGVRVSKLTLREAKTRWGSCSSKGAVMINWKIIMAPLEMIDYVVVHELCHLKHMNHSKNFWDLVASIIPDYKKRRLWLKEHSQIVSNEPG
ncbi:M48 family metallopeptidase [Anaeromicropila populeti]|uniref:YgjP-like metallopeptidase domain-containing protein n=1 Tax=Anaeromicropila populeti TaxID=37658 RepID=A0A1I6IR25_9FIRM|nr:SprT family zinc-dependent metalloprotease [Anaeromicropila populeti]SFR69168.1 hypothetical protein SAMN05661086_01064 [Anaeromicropila populeti]